MCRRRTARIVRTAFQVVSAGNRRDSGAPKSKADQEHGNKAEGGLRFANLPYMLTPILATVGLWAIIFCPSNVCLLLNSQGHCGRLLMSKH
jgi:hypothetical protein